MTQISIPQSEEVLLGVVPRVAPGLGIPVRGREHRGQEEERGGRERGETVGHDEGIELHWVVAGELHLVVGGAPLQVHSTPVSTSSDVLFLLLDCTSSHRRA